MNYDRKSQTGNMDIVNKTSKNLTTEDLKAMYRLMLMSRKFTDRALNLYEQGDLPTAMHPSAGQEALSLIHI